MTALIGRHEELHRARQLLLQTETRLVTLTGTGGMGKTRLALQIAHDLLEEFVDGVWFVPLAAVDDPLLVASALAATLGILGNVALAEGDFAQARALHQENLAFYRAQGNGGAEAWALYHLGLDCDGSAGEWMASRHRRLRCSRPVHNNKIAVMLQPPMLCEVKNIGQPR